MPWSTCINYRVRKQSSEGEGIELKFSDLVAGAFPADLYCWPHSSIRPRRQCLYVVILLCKSTLQLEFVVILHLWWTVSLPFPSLLNSSKHQIGLKVCKLLLLGLTYIGIIIIPFHWVYQSPVLLCAITNDKILWFSWLGGNSIPLGMCPTFLYPLFSWWFCFHFIAILIGAARNTNSTWIFHTLMLIPLVMCTAGQLLHERGPLLVSSRGCPHSSSKHCIHSHFYRHFEKVLLPSHPCQNLLFLRTAILTEEM